MPKGVPDEFWGKVSTRNKFMRLCKKAIKPSVDWRKFHEIDEEGLFEEFDTPILSAQFRKIRFQRRGLCSNCGKNKAIKKNSLCKICRNKVRESQRGE